MKTIQLLFGLLLTVSLFVSCSKEEEPTTGTVVISVENQSLYNTSDFLVDAAIVINESDSGTLVKFDRSDISNGKSVEFLPQELSPGNYYVRVQYLHQSSPWGSLRHKPFQVRLGEETFVTVVR